MVAKEKTANRAFGDGRFNVETAFPLFLPFGVRLLACAAYLTWGSRFSSSPSPP